MLGPRDGGVGGRGRVRVDEIEVGAVLDPLPQHRVVALLQTAPPDHRKARAAFDLYHLSRQQPEALVTAMLLRLFEEELVTKAHAQQRLARSGHVHDAATEAVFGELLQGRRESPYSRQDDSVCLLKFVGIRG